MWRVMFYFNLNIIFYLILFPFILIGQINKTSDSKISGSHGLTFEKESVTVLADSSYTENIQLLNLGEKTQAIQFRLSFNNAEDDSTVLVFEDIQKGTDLSDPSWLLDYNVIKGQVLKNGASKDEVFVVLYNINLDGGLLPGDHPHFITVRYSVAKVSSLQSEIKSSIKITNAEASTSKGFAVDIKPSRDEFRIIVKENNK